MKVMIQNLFSFFFFFFRGLGSLSQPRLNIFTVDNMGVMICLGQGGLRSLSASSLFYLFRTIVIELMCLHEAFNEYCFTDICRVSLGVSGWEGNILKYI